MSRLVVSRQVDVTTDRERFIFVGLAADCDQVAAAADKHGWNVVDSGVMRDGAWITLAKFADAASPFPELYHAVGETETNGRIALEVAS